MSLLNARYVLSSISQWHGVNIQPIDVKTGIFMSVRNSRKAILYPAAPISDATKLTVTDGPGKSWLT